ncbi:hypothetical protein LTR94_025477, partial [Friedmanniomyces endolithicus]
MAQIDLRRKLAVLADAAKYDASCASSGSAKRDSLGGRGIGSTEGMGICHAYTPDGRCVSLLKILLTNFCIYDCAYCINRVSSNVERARFTVQEVVDLTLAFYKRNYIEGLFLSSGVIRNGDYTMEQLVEVARILREVHDFRGYIHLKLIPEADPRLVDLAGLRDAIADQGGDPAKVNPVVPTQLIVDHSLAVEHGGFDPDAFTKNRAIEDRRNEDRFDFIEWTRRAFDNVDVVPAGNGIMHQINLEKMSPVIQVRDGVAFPDTCVGTDSHTPHVDALGVIAVGVGGLEAETVMLGRPSMMRLPDIVGVKLTGRRPQGITATDVVLALTEFLRKERVVGAWLEFFGPGADSLPIGDRATISNMCPEYGATAAMFYIDRQTLDYLLLTNRAPEQVALVETYAQATGLWGDALATAKYERVLTFDLDSVERTLAGPSNPHRRLPTAALHDRGVAKDLEGAIAQEREG